MNKYGNRRVTVGSEVFDSKKEYHRYLELKQMQDSGQISDLQRQVKYVLIPSQYVDGYYDKKGKYIKKRKCLERELSYYADFQYMKDGRPMVEDVKSPMTRKLAAYVIKRKLMLAKYGIQIKEV